MIGIKEKQYSMSVYFLDFNCIAFNVSCIDKVEITQPHESFPVFTFHERKRVQFSKQLLKQIVPSRSVGFIRFIKIRKWCRTGSLKYPLKVRRVILMTISYSSLKLQHTEFYQRSLRQCHNALMTFEKL